jgi:hypothetical protein
MKEVSVITKLNKVIKICKNNNIKRIKVDGILIEFGDMVKTTVEMPPNFDNIKSEKMPSDEEFLLMSTQFEVDNKTESKDPFDPIA